MPTDKQIEAALTAYTASYKGFGTRRSAMVAALTAAEQAEPAPAALSGAVKVKPLEWKDERNCECSAETVIGTYEVGFDDGWWAQLEGGVKWDWDPPYDPRSYEGPSAAKAAAQADYERRILAALEPAEPATDAEPVAWLTNGKGENWEERNVVTFDKETADMKAATEWWTVEPLYTRPPESRLREALARHAQAWSNVLELNLIPERYRSTAIELRDHAHALAQGADDERA